MPGKEPARPSWLLRASLVANVALLAVFTVLARRGSPSPADAPRATTDPAPAGDASVAGDVGPGGATPEAGADARNNLVRFTWRQLADPDLREYARRLREAGVPEPVVRDILLVELERRRPAMQYVAPLETN